jgi:uncharacterized protein YbjQ (UPF0145 family)
MLVATTDRFEGMKITHYFGMVSGEAIQGTNIIKDMSAMVRDYVGGRSNTYELELRQARMDAVEEMKQHAQRMGANAVIAVQLDHETVGARGSMLMVTATGTAVTLEGQEAHSSS